MVTHFEGINLVSVQWITYNNKIYTYLLRRWTKAGTDL